MNTYSGRNKRAQCRPVSGAFSAIQPRPIFPQFQGPRESPGIRPLHYSPARPAGKGGKGAPGKAPARRVSFAGKGRRNQRKESPGIRGRINQGPRERARWKARERARWKGFESGPGIRGTESGGRKGGPGKGGKRAAKGGRNQTGKGRGKAGKGRGNIEGRERAGKGRAFFLSPFAQKKTRGKSRPRPRRAAAGKFWPKKNAGPPG